MLISDWSSDVCSSDLVALVDAVEALLGVDVLDAGPNVERVVVLLGLLVGVVRLAVTEGPLTFGATLGWPRSACRPGFGRVRTRVVSGKSESVSCVNGGRRLTKKKKSA